MATRTSGRDPEVSIATTEPALTFSFASTSTAAIAPAIDARNVA